MSEDFRPKDPGSLWRSQPLDKVEVNMQALITRRMRDLRARTRMEIIFSIVAGMFFAVIAGWRILSAQDLFQQAGVGLVVIWILISAYRFRAYIWQRDPRPADALAAPAAEHYRRELEIRRDHLRNIWIWNGPLVLALLFFLITLGRAVYPHLEQLVKAIPFLTALLVWLIFTTRQRRRQVREIEEEIQELRAS
jgi:hypothetical protein